MQVSRTVLMGPTSPLQGKKRQDAKKQICHISYIYPNSYLSPLESKEQVLPKPPQPFCPHICLHRFPL